MKLFLGLPFVRTQSLKRVISGLAALDVVATFGTYSKTSLTCHQRLPILQAALILIGYLNHRIKMRSLNKAQELPLCTWVKT
jgi:hypothetical protein